MLDEKDRNTIFSQPITNDTWLDYGAYVRFILAADRILGKGDFSLISEATIFNARRDLNGIYRLFISFATPKMVLNNAPKLWSRYFDTGVMTVNWLESKKIELILKDYPDIPLHHEKPHMGFIGETIRMSGAKKCGKCASEMYGSRG